MNFVPCLTWVSKGIAKSVPDKVQLSAEELKLLIQETKDDIKNQDESDEEAGDDGSGNENNKKEQDEPVDGKEKIDRVDSDEDFDAKYDLDGYDDSDDERPFMNLGDVTMYVDNKEDEYMTGLDAVGEDEKEEENDFEIKENDNLLIVGHVEEESSILEIHVYNKEENEFYVHHDIVLPAYPLALEWLNYHPSDETRGNYVAVGDMSPIIKVWDLDVADILEPDYCLGEKKKKKKKKTEEKTKLNRHTDAVLSLSWNKYLENVLASGSADSSIILWDLETSKAVNRLRYHPNKVQALQWNPFENSYLLSGCTDGVIKLYDNRSKNEYKSWSIDGEVEKVCWNLSDSSKFLCSTDNGIVYSFDLRNDEISHTLQAHSEAVTALDICPQRPNILMTSSMDKMVKLWDMDQQFKPMCSTKLKVGSIYTAKFAPDSELVLAVGGNYASNSLKVIDLAGKLFGTEDVDDPTLDQSDDLNGTANQSEDEDTSPPKKKAKKAKKKNFQSSEASWNMNSGPSTSATSNNFTKKKKNKNKHSGPKR